MWKLQLKIVWPSVAFVLSWIYQGLQIEPELNLMTSLIRFSFFSVPKKKQHKASPPAIGLVAPDSSRVWALKNHNIQGPQFSSPRPGFFEARQAPPHQVWEPRPGSDHPSWSLGSCQAEGESPPLPWGEDLASTTSIDLPKNKRCAN